MNEKEEMWAFFEANHHDSERASTAALSLSGLGDERVLVGRLTQTSPFAGTQAGEPLDHERHENSTKLAKGECPFRGFRPFRDIRAPKARH